MDGFGRGRRGTPWTLGIGRWELVLAALAAVGVAVFVGGVMLAMRLVVYLLSEVGPT